LFFFISKRTHCRQSIPQTGMDHTHDTFYIP